MPMPFEAAPRPPEDFASLLATKEPVLLVGGQAVNLWALYYEARTVELAPFVSRDVDILGDRESGATGRGSTLGRSQVARLSFGQERGVRFLLGLRFGN